MGIRADAEMNYVEYRQLALVKGKCLAYIFLVPRSRALRFQLGMNATDIPVRDTGRPD